MIMKKRNLIFCVISLSLLLATISSVIAPAAGTDTAQSTATPAPTAEKKTNQNSLEEQTGDTKGLILGATVIVIAIFIGIFIQNIPIKNNPDNNPLQDKNQEKP